MVLMLTLKKVAGVLALFLILTGCASSYSIDENRNLRVGAICKDGTTSEATGRGACSHHGGVREWLY